MDNYRHNIGLYTLLILVSFSAHLVATAPTALFSDSALMHNVYGPASPPVKRGSVSSRVFISPFYQAVPAHTGAYNEFGKKVSSGNRLGLWNMLGTFFGLTSGQAPDGCPPLPNVGCSDKAFDMCNYPKLHDAFLVLDGDVQTSPADTIDSTRNNYTNEMEFLECDPCGRYSVTADYEKYGVRFGLDFTSGIGLGFSIRSGIVEYSHGPRDGCRKVRKKIKKSDGMDSINDCGDFEFEQLSECNTTVACVKQKEFVKGFEDLTSKGACKNVESIEPGGDIKDSDLITQYLMEPEKRIAISKELGYKNQFREFCTTEFEDTHVQAHWTYPFSFRDEDDVHVVNFIPYLAIGAWLPTGRSQDPDVIFSLPTGNDGFTGLTLEAALNFAFADYDGNQDAPTLQASVGSGITLFDSRETSRMRVPTSCFQVGVIPWHASVKRRQGTTWNIYTTLQALNYISSLSFYGSYVYTRHENDNIQLSDDDCPDDCPADCAVLPNGERAQCFLPKVLEQRSIWRSQVVHAGFDYAVTDNLSFGFSVQAYLAGRRVFRPTTVMGAVTFTF